ncbi:MAG: AIR carboxylase family protein [Candidatus Woesearchaeota archaeon]
MSDKLLLIGMGSPSDLKHFEKPYASLDGTIPEYLLKKGVRLYLSPGTGKPLVTSIHRTTDTAMKFADSLDSLVAIEGRNDRFVALLFGGLAFHLGGAFAGKNPAIPTIVAAMDEHAFMSAYAMPKGTPVGLVGVNQLDKAVMMATKILDYNDSNRAWIIHHHFTNPPSTDREHLVKSSYDAATQLLQKCNVLSWAVEFIFVAQKKYKGVSLSLPALPQTAIEMDKRLILGSVSFVNPAALSPCTTGQYQTLMDVAGQLKNSLLVHDPYNAALFTIQVIANKYPDLRLGLDRIKEESRLPTAKGGYSQFLPIKKDDFK